MDTAFQADAFQNDAFQIAAPATSSEPNRRRAKTMLHIQQRPTKPEVNEDAEIVLLF